MSVTQMGLPDDMLERRLRKLIESSFDFDDLLEALAERSMLMDEIAAVIEKHNRGPHGRSKTPPVRFAPEDVPSFVDLLVGDGFHRGPAASLRVAVELTSAVRRTTNEPAKDKVVELLAAIERAFHDDLMVRRVTQCCAAELD